MLYIDNQTVAANLPWDQLVSALSAAFDGSLSAPPRQVYEMTARDGDSGRLLIMPAWQDDELIGIKLVTHWESNIQRGIPTHGANYLLLDARSGNIKAILAAEALTSIRTAALSLLATRFLKPLKRRLLVLGTGPVAEQLVRGHAASSGFEKIGLYSRSAERAAAFAARLDDLGLSLEIVMDLESAVRDADLIAAATNASAPILHGAWLSHRAHVHLFGGFTPLMREADDELFVRANEIWVDTWDAASEAGDLIHPINSAALDRSAIRGDLKALIESRSGESDGIVVFKSVGIAIADFIAARTVLQNSRRAA